MGTNRGVNTAMKKKTRESMGYPARHGKTWTAEEMWNLVELYIKPITWNTIATRMQRTISACQGRMHLLKLACALSTDKTGEQIVNGLAKNPDVQHKTDDK